MPDRSKDNRPHNPKSIPLRTRENSRRMKHYRLRCDCGQLAITVIRVTVGTDPQYSVQLPLCASCLALEHSFDAHV